MAAVLYRIDGSQRAFSGLFPEGAGASYDDYGVAVFAGTPKTITIAGSGNVTVSGLAPIVTVASSDHITVPQSTTVAVAQTATITLPEE